MTEHQRHSSRTAKVMRSAVVIGVILIAIIIYAVYRGQTGPMPEGNDPTQSDGIEYVPQDAQHSLR